MHAVAAEQGDEIAEAWTPESRRRVDSTVLDMATRGYLRGQITLDEFTRCFDEYLETVDRRQHTEKSDPHLPDATVRLARWLKHVLSALSERGQAKSNS